MQINASVLSLLALLSVGPVFAASGDLDASFESLKQAEAQKDPALIKQKAVETATLASAIISQPAPTADYEKQQVEHAREIETYAEYTLYSTAIQNPPAVTADLLATLVQVNPKSQYLEEGYPRYFLVLNQTGAGAKIPGIAEAGLKALPDNGDLLMALADSALSKQQKDTALSYADRAIAALPKRSKPEMLSAAAWAKKRDQQLGHAYFISGAVRCDKADYFNGDKNLRLALPLVGDNKELRAGVLFYLGVANYQLGTTMLNKARVLEAIKFTDEAASYKNAYTMQAWRNSSAMKAQAARMR